MLPSHHAIYTSHYNHSFVLGVLRPCLDRGQLLFGGCVVSLQAPSSYFSSAAAEAKGFAQGISKNEEPTTEGLPGGKEYNPAPHPSKAATDQDASYLLMHPVYSKEYVESVKPKHRPPENVRTIRMTLLK